MPASQAVERQVYCSHAQFFVVDPSAEPLSGAAELWDGAALERHLGVLDGLVAVGTVGCTFLPVELEVWNEEPPLDAGWDHVTEASLELRSGRLSLAGVERPEELEPLQVAAGTYRVRASGRDLDGADELDGGDHWRVQVWPAAPAEPVVLRWWPLWDPAGATPLPTTGAGRVLVGAEANDARVKMRWLASRGEAHLFQDGDGRYWEHSNLPDRAGTPQLEELGEGEAERRYANRESWGAITGRPSIWSMLRNIWRAR